LNISYGVPKQKRIRLAIYNSLGIRVTLIRDETLSPGYYHTSLNLSKYGLSNGLYWLMLEQGERKITEKIILAR